MVYAHCLDYKSVNHMPDWFKRTDLNTILNLEELTEKRLLHALDSLSDARIEQMQKDIFQAVKSKCKLASSGIVYDVTNTYLYGTKCQMAKLGKSKDGKNNRPLIQIGLGVTQKEGIPIFHKTFDGNIHDSKTISCLIDELSFYGMKTGTLIYDRGCTSIENIKNIKKLGQNILCGIAIRNTEKKIIRKIIKFNSMVNISNRVALKKNNSFYAVSKKHKIGNVSGKLIVCFNERMRLDIKESRYFEILNAQDSIKKGKAIKKGLEKYLSPSGRVRKNELEVAEEFDGYSCIFSTKNITNKEVVRLYFEKDIVEKAFKSLKGVVNLRPICHWLYNRVISHVFICYLSYLLLSVLKLKLKEIGISSEKAMKELGGVYKIYLSNSKKYEFSKIVTFTKSQEKILKSVNKELLRKR